MAKFDTRLTFVQVGLAAGLVLVLAQSARLQLVRGSTYAAEAERSRTAHEVLPARRGAIRDRNGVPLAITQEYYHVGIAPNELADPGADARTIARALGLPPDRLRRALA
ncbi:MAG TPA: hypothetical protein VFS07_03910, partial [Gemmatimonadales bacterium]|nr:hypothetical protein [Gemmatimonadales bacterium]